MNKILYLFSAFIVLLISFTGCDTTVEPPLKQKQTTNEIGQVIIAEGTSSEPIQSNPTEVQQQEYETNQSNETNEIDKTDENNQTNEQAINDTQKTEYISSPTQTEKSKTSSFLNWGESNNQYWTKLKTVAQMASSFYQNNGSRFTLLSKDGKLYNSSTDSYITANYLKNNGLLDESFSDFKCDILLIRGSDIAKYIDTDMPSSSLGIDIFTAIKQPSGNKIMLSSSTEKIASISEENYEALLNEYHAYHGNVSTLSPQMEEYERILNFIRVYEGNYDKYYVRNIRADRKYAVVTFSTQTAPNNIKQYVLVNKDGFWEVAINDLDKQANLNYALNHILPDCNLSLLPPYNVSFYKNDMKTDFSDVLKYMVFHELIEQQSQVQYICGTTSYCYVVLYGGERYLGKKLNDEWDIWKVKSASDAVAAMELDNNNPPTFIVLDE